MAEEQIDRKHLKGLKYSTSRPVKNSDGVTVHIPDQRQLAPADVLDWKDNGGSVTIVTADGKKHTVAKEAEKS